MDAIVIICIVIKFNKNIAVCEHYGLFVHINRININDIENVSLCSNLS